MGMDNHRMDRLCWGHARIACMNSMFWVRSELLEAAGLVYKEHFDVIHVGVHPCNREEMGLVIADVIELEVSFCKEGWADDLANMLAVEIGKLELGKSWCTANKKLWEASQGLLAATNSDELKIVTLRGGHSTASIRNIKLSAKCPDPSVTLNGHIKTEAVLEENPTLRGPCKSIEYFIE